jgi:hypothetical protein
MLLAYSLNSFRTVPRGGSNAHSPPMLGNQLVIGVTLFLATVDLVLLHFSRVIRVRLNARAVTLVFSESGGLDQTETPNVDNDLRMTRLTGRP